jgi:exosortase/archaeosortase family protein
VVVAYSYSLLSLIRNLTIDSPIAYLGLVPFIAVALMLVKARARADEPDIHDRHVDYIVGLPLLASALAVLVFLPVRESTFFWLWRVDLLSLPFFVAGTIALIFGVRVLWRLRVAVAFLFLAWPVSYTAFLNGATERFASLTSEAVRLVVQVIPLAQPVAGADGVFSVGDSSSGFLVSIGSACTGINGVVGFLLVGAAFSAVVSGPLISRAVWLAGGMALIWVVNLVRIIAVFAVGLIWGESAALDWFHPVIGLVTFNLALIAMIVVLPRFRLTIGPRTNDPRSRSFAPRPSGVPRFAVQRIALASVTVLMISVVASIADAQLERYQVLAQDFGAPRLSALSTSGAQLNGWSLQQADAYPWVRQYFGADATWNRYEYDWVPSSTTSSLQSTEPVVMDVIATSDLNAFTTFGLEDCYRFHNYKILDARSIDLGAGVTGHALTYMNPSTNSSWLAVYWEWPVASSSGSRFERVVINMFNPDPGQLVAPPLTVPLAEDAKLALNDWLGSSDKHELRQGLRQARDFLIGFSQQVVSSAAESQ